MVSVVVVRPFRYRDINVYDGQCIEMEAIDAIVKAREGLVSVMHGRTYQTRDMVAESPVQAMTIESFAAPPPAIASESDMPPKRRRGRPRKVKAL